jgi:uncharacterized protein (TIGR03437 family)
MNTPALPPRLSGPPLVPFDYSSSTAAPVTKTITVDNGSGVPTPVTYRIVYPNAEAAGWLTAASTTLVTPVVFKVTGSPAGFGPGRYLAQLIVSPVSQEIGSGEAVPITLIMSVGVSAGGTGPLRLQPQCSWLSASFPTPAIQTDLEKQVPCSYIASASPTDVTLAATSATGTPQRFSASLSFSTAQTDWLTARVAMNPIPNGGSAGGVTVAPVAISVQPGRVTRSPETAFVSAVLEGKAGGDVAIITAAAASSLSVSPRAVTFDASSMPPQPATITLTAIGGALPFDVVPSVPWLSVSLSSGMAQPATASSFTVTADPSALGTGQHAGNVTIRRTDDPSKDGEVVFVTLNKAPQDGPQITAVVNGASFQPPAIGPGSWVTIKGTSLADGPAAGRIWRAEEILDGKLPTSLDGVSVRINDIPAYVQYISPAQLNVVAPGDSSDGPVTVVVNNKGRISAAVTAQLQRFAPAFFLEQQIQKYVTASLLPSYRYIGNPAVDPGFVPARPGDIISLWLTGLGPTQPASPDGYVPILGSPVVSTPTVFLDGRQIPAGNYLAAAISEFPATYQINIRIPDTVPDGDVAITVTVGGVSSPGGAFLYVRR